MVKVFEEEKGRTKMCVLFRVLNIFQSKTRVLDHFLNEKSRTKFFSRLGKFPGKFFVSRRVSERIFLLGKCYENVTRHNLVNRSVKNGSRNGSKSCRMSQCIDIMLTALFCVLRRFYMLGYIRLYPNTKNQNMIPLRAF